MRAGLKVLRRVPEIALGAMLATAIWVVVLLFALDPSTYHQICETDQYGHERCAPHNLLYVGFWYFSYVINAGTITAFATAFIAWFTLTLKRSTDKLWDAGERQLRALNDSADRQSADMQASVAAAQRSADIAEKALLSVEIPYLYPFVRQHGFITNVSQFTKVLAVNSFDFGNDFIKFYFKNFGRTPAEITEVQSILIPSMGMPRPYPAGERNLNRLSGQIVAADGGESQDFPQSFDKTMFDALSGQIPRFRLEIVNFWFLGFVRYSDVFENEYVRGFCLAYSPMTNRFYPVGGDGFNYRKKTKSGGQPVTEPTPT
jgi:hypothetical protein